MITEEAKKLADKIYQDVISLNITKDKSQRLKTALLVAKSIQQQSSNAIWQYVINDLNGR